MQPFSLLRLFADIGKNTAVNIKDMSVDEVGCIGCKEYCRTLKVFSIAPASCRSLGNDELVERMAAAVSLSLSERGCLRCCDIARPDTVALDVVLAVL